MYYSCDRRLLFSISSIYSHLGRPAVTPVTLMSRSMSHFFSRVRKALTFIEMVFVGVLNHIELIFDIDSIRFDDFEVRGTCALKIRVVTLAAN